MADGRGVGLTTLIFLPSVLSLASSNSYYTKLAGMTELHYEWYNVVT